MPRVSAPSGGREPPGARWKERRDSGGLGTGRTPIDSAGLKVRRDKRTGPDGAEEPLAATAHKGGKRTRPGLGFIPWDSALLEAGGNERGVRVHVRRMRRSSSERLHLRFETILLLPPHLSRIVRRLARRAASRSPALSRLYNGNWAYTFSVAYTKKSNSMVTARANFMSIKRRDEYFFTISIIPGRPFMFPQYEYCFVYTAYELFCTMVHWIIFYKYFKIYF